MCGCGVRSAATRPLAQKLESLTTPTNPMSPPKAQMSRWFVLDGKRLVHPVPNETALQLVVLVNQVPVVLEVTYTVTHGMGIFAENHGAGITLVHVLAQPPDACVHGAIDVALGVVATPLHIVRDGWGLSSWYSHTEFRSVCRSPTRCPWTKSRWQSSCGRVQSYGSSAA